MLQPLNSEGICITPWEYTLGKWPGMAQNDRVLSGNAPKWGQQPVGAFLGVMQKPVDQWVRRTNQPAATKPHLLDLPDWNEKPLGECLSQWLATKWLKDVPCLKIPRFDRASTWAPESQRNEKQTCAAKSFCNPCLFALVAVDPAAKSSTFWGFCGKPLDFPKS